MGCCDNHEHNEKSSKKTLILNIIGVVLFVITIILEINNFQNYIYFYILSYLLIGYDILINAIKKLFKKDMFDENLLMTIATIGALCIGDYTEAVAVLLFYKVGEFLQDRAVDKSKEKIEKVLGLKSEYANLKENDIVTIVSPEVLKIGDVIVIKNGERVSIDGRVILGSTNVDMSVLTGESKPKTINNGDEILSGSINLGNVIEVEVLKTYDKSTVSEIINLIKDGAEKKSETEKFITKFSKVYTPIVVIIALLIAILLPVITNLDLIQSIERALIFLVISCPCALVISVPLGFFVGIGECSKKGILVKGSNYLDILSSSKTIVFDKTGTLTEGSFNISEINSLNSKYTEEEILKYVAEAESYSNHYIAKSIIKEYGKEIDKKNITNYSEIAGCGIMCSINKNNVLVGNSKLFKNNNIIFEDKNEVGTIVYLAINNEYIGNIVISDKIKESSFNIHSNLIKLGIENIVMLTGDKKSIAEKVASDIKFSKVYSELLPQDKFKILRNLKENDENIVYIGDGINDAPCIAEAAVGIGMGRGSDIAIETSDIVFMSDDSSKIVNAIRIAKDTKKVVIQNITFALLIKIIFLTLSIFGITTMWEAVFADVGVSLLVVINSMKIIKK